MSWPPPPEILDTLERAETLCSGADSLEERTLRGLLSLVREGGADQALLDLEGSPSRHFQLVYCAASFLRAAGHSALCLTLSRQLIRLRPHDIPFRRLYRWALEASDSPQDRFLDDSLSADLLRLEIHHRPAKLLRRRSRSLRLALREGDPQQIETSTADLVRLYPGQLPKLAAISASLPEAQLRSLLRGAERGRAEVHQPYRDSQLQQLLQRRLQDALSGGGTEQLLAAAGDLLHSSDDSRPLLSGVERRLQQQGDRQQARLIRQLLEASAQGDSSEAQGSSAREA